MDKKILRKKYLKIRQSCNVNTENICKKLFYSSEFINAEIVFTYVSFGNEISTYKIIEECFKLNKKVAVPKCVNNYLEFYYINALSDLELGFYNILGPKTDLKANDFKNSICITPGIVFDKKGYRIGYGKGYYDRFFKDYTGIKIGLCCKECLIDDVCPNEFDVPVDYVILD